MIMFVNKSSSEGDEFRGSEELHSRHHHVTCRCLSQVLGLPGPHSLLQGMVKGGILKLGNKKKRSDCSEDVMGNEQAQHNPKVQIKKC